MKKYAVIVAGGIGTRMNTKVPKQFLPLSGKPVLIHTLNRFASAVPDIHLILALPESHFSLWRNLCREYNFDLPLEIVSGGVTRFHSVKNALKKVESDAVVLVHDGVRPLISETLIRNVIEEAAKKGSAIPYTLARESVRIVKDTKNYSFKRDEIALIQTPQGFNAQLLLDAYNQDYQDDFTDDASVFERKGHPIHLVEGENTNLKITTHTDLVVAEALFNLV